MPQIGLSAVAALAIGGLAFGQCDASSIAGPSALTESPVVSTVGTGSLGSETFRENTMDRNAVFVGVNPCNGEPVVARGKRHDRFSSTISLSGFSADHHINDSFKSVPLDAQGVEVADPELEYVGSDTHNDKFSVDFSNGTTSHRELTNEHLSRRGGGDHWVLHIDQRTEFSVDDPEPQVTVTGHASCPPTSHCKLPGGCPDRAFSLTSLGP